MITSLQKSRTHPRFRLGSVQVTSIEATTATVRVKYSSEFYANTTGCGSVQFSSAVEWEVIGPAGCQIRLPTVTVEVAAIAPGTVVLRFAVPAATDGTDLGACADGRCAVLVDRPVPIPLNPQFKLRNLRVTSITANAIIITFDYERYS